MRLLEGLLLGLRLKEEQRQKCLPMNLEIALRWRFRTRAYNICLVQVQRLLVVRLLEEPVVEFEYLRLFSVAGC